MTVATALENGTSIPQEYNIPPPPPPPEIYEDNVSYSEWQQSNQAEDPRQYLPVPHAGKWDCGQDGNDICFKWTGSLIKAKSNMSHIYVKGQIIYALYYLEWYDSYPCDLIDGLLENYWACGDGIINWYEWLWITEEYNHGNITPFMYEVMKVYRYAYSGQTTFNRAIRIGPPLTYNLTDPAYMISRDHNNGPGHDLDWINRINSEYELHRLVPWEVDFHFSRYYWTKNCQLYNSCFTGLPD